MNMLRWLLQLSLSIEIHGFWPYQDTLKSIDSTVIKTIELADSTKLQSLGIGTIVTPLISSDNGERLQLREALYVPGLKSNLISISQL